MNFPCSSRESGAVAQLGARVNGIHEVAGSIPASSTKHRFVHVGGLDLHTMLTAATLSSLLRPSMPLMNFKLSRLPTS